jgi:hypothetical protein
MSASVDAKESDAQEPPGQFTGSKVTPHRYTSGTHVVEECDTNRANSCGGSPTETSTLYLNDPAPTLTSRSRRREDDFTAAWWFTGRLRYADATVARAAALARVEALMGAAKRVRSGL